MKNTVTCGLCGEVCKMQVSASHLRSKHNMTTTEYKALGYKTLSPARLEQLRNSPVARGEINRPEGPDHWNWKGGHVISSGYKITYRNGRRDYEHRFVAEDMLGRPLEDNEVVHHKDGDRLNNDPSNLEVMSTSRHNQKPRKGIARTFATGPDVEAAARFLVNHGWSVSRTAKALRVEPRTVSRWQDKPIWTDEYFNQP